MRALLFAVRTSMMPSQGQYDTSEYQSDDALGQHEGSLEHLYGVCWFAFR